MVHGGVIDYARQGKRALIVERDQRAVRDRLDAIARTIAEAPEEGVSVYSANGGERITWPNGGEILIRRAPTGSGSWRGLSARVWATWSALASMPAELVTDLQLVGVTSGHGLEVIK